MIELISFLVRPFCLGLRLFVAMTAGHILLEGAGRLRHQRRQCRAAARGVVVGMPSFVLMIGISRARSCWCARIQAYVFALLTSLYLNDAINLH